MKFVKNNRDKVVLTFLGSGSAFVSHKENYQSNMLITVNGKNLLIDAGTSLLPSMENLDLKLTDIDSIYISHNHSDHIGGLEYVALGMYFGQFPFGINKPKLIANTEVIDELWKKGLSAGLSTLQNQKAKLKTYFDVKRVRPNGSFTFEGIKFHLIQTVHVVDRKRIMPSYGLWFEVNDKKIFITTDAQSNPNQMVTFYDNADMIFQDCELAKYPGSVHAQYHELCNLPDSIKEKMHLYHYSNDKNFDFYDEQLSRDKLVQRGQSFILGGF